ncbi:MAG: hypothetical protein QXT40_01555 [Candidatus Micrarchaeia archaeon]
MSFYITNFGTVVICKVLSEIIRTGMKGGVNGREFTIMEIQQNNKRFLLHRKV